MVRLSETVVLHRWLVCRREDQGLGLGPQPADRRMCHEAAEHHGYGPGPGAGAGVLGSEDDLRLTPNPMLLSWYPKGGT